MFVLKCHQKEHRCIILGPGSIPKNNTASCETKKNTVTVIIYHHFCDEKKVRSGMRDGRGAFLVPTAFPESARLARAGSPLKESVGQGGRAVGLSSSSCCPMSLVGCLIYAFIFRPFSPVVYP